MRSLLLYLLAFTLAVLANYLFTGEWITRRNETHPDLWSLRHALGACSLLLAITIGAVSFSRRDDFTLPRRPACGRLYHASVSWRAFIPCGSVFLLSQLTYLIGGESAVVRGLWLASICALLVPLLRTAHTAGFWPLPRWEYLLLTVILIVAFAARYVNITELPLHIDNDVSIMGLFSKKLIVENDWTWVGMAPTDHQFSEHQFHALSMRLFGTSLYGLVMSSVLAGTASVGIVYFLGKMLFNRPVGFIAATFLSFNYVHVHFSRIIFGPLTTFFVMVASLFLLHGLRKASPLSFAIGGVSMGMGLLGYYSGRVGPVLGGALFVLWFLQRRNYPRVTAKCWVAAFLGVLMVFGPNLIYSLQESDQFNGRGREVILWTDGAWNHLAAKYASDGNPFVVLKEQLLRTVLAPFFFPDESTICHLRQPMLDAVAAVFFALGLGYCLRRAFRVETGYLLLWIGFTFLLGGVLTIDPPFWPHLNIATPAMAVVAAIGAERFSHRLAISGPSYVRPLVVTALLGLLVFSVANAWNVYHEFARRHAGGRTLAMREVEKLPPGHRVFIVSRGIEWSAETFQFLTPHVDGSNIREEDLLVNVPEIDRPTTFLVSSDADEKCLALLRERFPSAIREQFFDGWGWPAFTAVRVFPRDYVQDMRGIGAQSDRLWSRSGWRVLFTVFVVFVFLVVWVSTRRRCQNFPSR